MFLKKKLPLFIGLLLAFVCTNCNDAFDELNHDREIEQEISSELSVILEEALSPLRTMKEKGGNMIDVIHSFEQTQVEPEDYVEIGINYERIAQKTQILQSLLEQLTYFHDKPLLEERLTDLSMMSLRRSKLVPTPINARIAGTPCYDSFEVDTYAASVGYSICLLTPGYTPPGLTLCTVLYASTILVAEYNYDSCMEQYAIE